MISGFVSEKMVVYDFFSDISEYLVNDVGVVIISDCRSMAIHPFHSDSDFVGVTI